MLRCRQLAMRSIAPAVSRVQSASSLSRAFSSSRAAGPALLRAWPPSSRLPCGCGSASGGVGGSSRAMSSSSGSDDYYGVLGIPKDAGKSDVKKAYYREAKKCHPDTNANDPAAAKKFAELTEAYETLSDDQKRQAYDTFGKAGVDGSGGGGFPGGGFPGGGFPGGGFPGGFQGQDAEDIFGAFEQIFGQRRGPRRGRDVQIGLEIELSEAAKGSRQTLRWRSPEGPRSLEVDVPAGVDSGNNLRVPGQGEEGPGGRGNLYVQITVPPHPIFERDGMDIHVKVRLTLTEALLGTKVTVPTLDGDVSLKVPPGTRSADRRVMTGRGLKIAGQRQPGHQFIHFEVLIPRKLSERQRALVEEFGEEEESLGDEARLAREGA